MGLVAGSEASELSQLSEDELLDFVEKVSQRGKERKVAVLAGAPLRLNLKELAAICEVPLLSFLHYLLPT